MNNMHIQLRNKKVLNSLFFDWIPENPLDRMESLLWTWKWHCKFFDWPFGRCMLFSSVAGTFRTFHFGRNSFVRLRPISILSGSPSLLIVCFRNRRRLSLILHLISLGSTLACFVQRYILLTWFIFHSSSNCSSCIYWNVIPVFVDFILFF